MPLVYRFFSLNILVFAALFASAVQENAVSRVFFVWLSVFNLFVISVFWSVMADHFSSEQGKRLFGFIAAGGTAGALLGPALAAALSVRFGVALLAVIAALLLEAAVHCFRRLAAVARTGGADTGGSMETARHHDERLGGGVLAGISLIRNDRYLLGIVAYLLLHSFASTLLYFEQGRIVAAGFRDTAARTQFFALVDLSVSALALVLQLFVSGHLIRRAGVAAALALLPLSTMAALAALAASPVAAVLATVQVLRRALDYAVARPARETLFTVVARGAKYKAKNVIDTVVYRGGDAASGWISAALAAGGAGMVAVSAAFATLTALWVALSVWLARRQALHAVVSKTKREDSHDTRIE